MYRTVVVYGCETWSLILREEHRLRMSANRVEENIWAKEERGKKGVEKTT
jgi:hypothetical protein